MPTLSLTDDQKAQLAGWLNKEKDLLLTLKSTASQSPTLRCTETFSSICGDYEIIFGLRRLLSNSRHIDLEVDEDQFEILSLISKSNQAQAEIRSRSNLMDEAQSHLKFWESMNESINASR